MHIQSFINAELQKSKTSIVKLNPFTGDPLHQTDSIEVMQIIQAIQGAQRAFSEWKDSKIELRIQLLQNIKKVLNVRGEEFARLEAVDQGLPLRFTLAHNIQACVDTIDRCIQELTDFQDSNKQKFSGLGVISLIVSWNLSLRIVFERLIPALAAGNAVLVKMSSNSPITGFILAELLKAVDCPKGLVQIIHSNQQEIKDLLVTHPSIKASSFVGSLKNSSDVLKKVSQLSANQFKKLQISSGSKNTAIALTPPDDQVFQQILDSFMFGQGQLAWNSNRLFILEKYEKQWVDKLSTYLNNLKPSKGIEDLSLWGPCLRQASFDHFSEIENLAKADQAQLIQSSRILSEQEKKCFLRPTFTKDMSNCSTLQQDQIPAPLFILSVVKYPFDIAKYSNVSYYGQSAHIWGEESKIEKIADQLEVAQICKNKWSVQIHTPNQGVKQSAYGFQDYRVFGGFYSNVKNLT